jgi:hypothetical protein
VEIDRGAAIRGVEKRVVVETTVECRAPRKYKECACAVGGGYDNDGGDQEKVRQRSHRPGTEPALPA